MKIDRLNCARADSAERNTRGSESTSHYMCAHGINIIVIWMHIMAVDMAGRDRH